MDADDKTNVLGWVGYARKSTEEQANSIPIQATDIEREAQRRGISLAGMYSDAISGKSVVGREGLSQAIAALKPGYALAVVRIDRLARNTPDFFVLIAQIRDKGCYLFTVDNGYYSSNNSSQVVFMMNAYVAEQERKTINKRTARGLKELKEEWIKHERPAALSKYVTLAPYGWVRDKNYHIGDLKAFVPVEEEQRVIEQIRELWKENPSLTYTAVAASLNEKGIPTRNGGKWYPATVRNIQHHEKIEISKAPNKFSKRSQREG